MFRGWVKALPLFVVVWAARRWGERVPLGTVAVAESVEGVFIQVDAEDELPDASALLDEYEAAIMQMQCEAMNVFRTRDMKKATMRVLRARAQLAAAMRVSTTA